MEKALQTFECSDCGWRFGSLSEPVCPGCGRQMNAVEGARRKKLCSHEETAQCTVRCFTSPDETGKKVAA